MRPQYFHCKLNKRTNAQRQGIRERRWYYLAWLCSHNILVKLIASNLHKLCISLPDCLSTQFEFSALSALNFSSLRLQHCQRAPLERYPTANCEQMSKTNFKTLPAKKFLAKIISKKIDIFIFATWQTQNCFAIGVLRFRVEDVPR